MSAVTIENHDGRYRLRWLYLGKRYTMSCGVPTTPTGKEIAKQNVAQIELDLSAGYFDHTLVKYRLKTLGKTATELTVPKLFKRFTEHQFKTEVQHLLKTGGKGNLRDQASMAASPSGEKLERGLW